MTNQEAKTLVREHREFVAFPPVIQGTVWRQKLIEALDLAIESLERADKYRWHDLRKNPEDLPKDAKPVLIADWVVCDEPHIGYELGIYSRLGWMRQTNHKIIAWREIEPFEEVEE